MHFLEGLLINIKDISKPNKEFILLSRHCPMILPSFQSQIEAMVVVHRQSPRPRVQSMPFFPTISRPKDVIVFCFVDYFA